MLMLGVAASFVLTALHTGIWLTATETFPCGCATTA